MKTVGAGSPSTQRGLSSFMLEQQAVNATMAYLARAESHFARRMPLPEIRFDLRGKAAGSFSVTADGALLIRYNRSMLQRYAGSFLERTVPHEVAHLVAYRVFGRRIRPHGRQWREVMHLFGAEASRCHAYQPAENELRRYRYFDYHCDCRQHRLSSIRHNRTRQGVRYLCRYCGSSLQPGLPCQ